MDDPTIADHAESRILDMLSSDASLNLTLYKDSLTKVEQCTFTAITMNI